VNNSTIMLLRSHRLASCWAPTTLLIPVYLSAPFRDQRTFLSPIAPAEIDTGVRGKLKVDLTGNVSKGRDAIESAHRRVQSSSPRFARLLTGFTQPFKSSSGTLS
jgi:hypothetical protein